MTPSVGVHPAFVRTEKVATQPNLSVFGCQLRPVSAPGFTCYSPQQIWRAYDIQPLLANGLDGTGHTIVIIDAFRNPLIEHDLQVFDADFDLPAPPSFVIRDDLNPPAFDFNDGNMVGWSGETSLDVLWAHAVAPGANIVLVQAKSNDDADILAATKFAYENNLGDILSQSYGEAEQCLLPAIAAEQHKVFSAMTDHGWTLFASSGDDGSDQPGCGPNDPPFQAASTPATDPNVTAVGGTQLNATPLVLSPLDLGGAYVSETTWNEPGIGAGGGGFSVLYKRPEFQPSNVTNSKSRAVPDVAYNAAVDGGVLTVWSVGDVVFLGAVDDTRAFIFGGTSAGSPQWAGLAAITDQLAGGRVGNINKTLYKLGKRNQSTYFHDIADGSNNGAFTATPGYDEATGWGSPIASAIVPALARGDH